MAFDVPFASAVEFLPFVFASLSGSVNSGNDKFLGAGFPNHTPAQNLLPRANCAAPGEADELRSYVPQKGGRPGRPAVTGKDDKVRRAAEMHRAGFSLREIEKTLGVAKSTIDRWLKDADQDASHSVPRMGQFQDRAEPDGETPN